MLRLQSATLYFCLALTVGCSPADSNVQTDDPSGREGMPKKQIAMSDVVQTVVRDGAKLCEITREGEVWFDGEKRGSIESNGEIWVAGNKVGSLEVDGEVWHNGNLVGRVTEELEVWKESDRVGEIESDGTIWHNGNREGSTAGGIPKHAAVIFFFDFFTSQ